MDTFFHFLFPMMAVFAARVHTRHGLLTILPLGIISVLIDIDHFIGVSRATFHNIFFTFFFPLVVIILAFKHGNRFQREFSLLLMIFLFSHIVADLFMEGTVYLLYPLSMAGFNLTGFVVMAGPYTIISSTSIGFALYFLMLLAIFFLEDIDRLIGNKRAGKGLGKVFRKVLQRDKKLIFQ